MQSRETEAEKADVGIQTEERERKKTKQEKGKEGPRTEEM